ncbi:HU family DNA-binding protein [Furfurilactobacillus entadae]|uniref:HU family DNA-binding protein n=1 Tax=Furfurilactobacillus entadae TaxID=2922307 RepID=UPI0035F0986D
MTDKVTKRDLVKAVAAQTACSQRETLLVMNALLDAIGEELAVGHEVELRNFGTFSVHTNKARIISDISGQPVHIPAHRLAKYRCGAGLRATLNKGTR